MAGLERQIAEASARRDELAQDQARLRENLAAVPAESDLARRYLGGLAASEDELDGAGSAPRRACGPSWSRRRRRGAAFVRSLRV